VIFNNIFLTLVLLISSTAYSQTPKAAFRPPAAVVGNRIPVGSIVPGTAQSGGQQPHFLIDTNNASVDAFNRSFNRHIQQVNPQNTLQRIDATALFVQNYFQETNYRGPTTCPLNQDFIRRNKPIPLSQIIANRAGVCREHNLVLNHLLGQQGIETSYVNGVAGNRIGTEQHSFLTYKDPQNPNRPNIVLDSFYDKFHGHNYDAFVNAHLNSDGTINSAQQYLFRGNNKSVFSRIRALEGIEDVIIVGERSHNAAPRSPTEALDSSGNVLEGTDLTHKPTRVNRCDSRALFDLILEATN